MSKTWFATYYSHYKDILGNLNWSFACITDYISLLYGWSNLLASNLTHNSIAYTDKPGKFTKKRELLRTSLYLFSHHPLSIFLNSTFLKICSMMFKYSMMSEYLVISKCAGMFKWQLSLILASFFLLINYPLVKLISKNIIKATEDCKYLISTQNLPVVSFDISFTTNSKNFARQ